MIAVNTDVKVVTKPWGRELWLVATDRYVMKQIEMNAGHRSSLQRHQKKDEINYILSGELELEIEDESGVPRIFRTQKGELITVRIRTYQLKAGDIFAVHPPLLHRVNAVTNYVAIEASTPEVDDVERLQDDAGRGDGRIPSEHTEVG